MEARPKVGVAVFIRQNNKILLSKRINTHGQGTWGLIGGHLEFGETPELCAKRETIEEIGLPINNLRYLCYTNDIFEKENKHYITLYFVADHTEGEPKNLEPEVCNQLEWFGWDELPDPLFLPVMNLREAGHNPFSV